jgi:hypothetical protein
VPVPAHKPLSAPMPSGATAAHMRMIQCMKGRLTR